MSSANHNWQKTKRTLSDSAIFLFNNKTMSDVTFVFNNNNSASKPIQIHAHSWILSMLSPVFYECFKANFEVLKQIPVSEASYDSFLQCIRFVYTSECILTQNNAFEVMAVAQKYSLSFLEEDCTDFIMRSVSVESVCPTLDNAITFGHNALTDKLIEFIAPNISPVLKTNSFPNIKKNSLEAILNIEKTGPITEMDIFEAIMKWAAHKCNAGQMVVNGSNKRSHLGELVKKIRFPTMNSVELGQCLAQEEGLLTAEEGYSLFLSAATKETNKHGFRNDTRKFLIDIDKIIESKISFCDYYYYGYRPNPDVFQIKSKFKVNKMIYITGLYIAISELTQSATIQFFNNKNIILFEETFVVLGNRYGNPRLSNPLLIMPNQEYIVDVKFEKCNCKFRFAQKQTVPFTKIKEGVEFCFSEINQLLDVFCFKSVD